MKRILSIIAFLLTTVTLCGQTPLDLANAGDDSYRLDNYPDAIEHYESVIASGMTSADLYYNLGNAYYREGQMAKAILNYERALRLRPSMDDAKENLALANSHTADRITELPRLFLVRWIDWLCSSVTPATWRVVWLLLLAAVGVSVVLLRLGRSLPLRKAGLVGAIISAVLLIIATVFLFSATAHFNSHSQAIVMEQTITVKSSPEQKSVDKMLLHEGTKVDILEELSGWYKIRIADGTTGWCQSSTIERI